MNTAVLCESDPERGPTHADFSAVERGSGVHPRRLRHGDIVAGKYLIRGVLGQGGFATVYDAEHLGLSRDVALKVLHLGADTQPALIDRFRREARISALVRHPNVLDVFDTGTLDDGSPYLVMERIYGQTLHERMAKRPMAIGAAVEIGRQVLTALHVLDEHRIVHRDIKPENLMLHDPGSGRIVVKVVDFGISKRIVPETNPRLTSNGALVGTPQYMSPEQLRGEDVDVRTDIYAMGVVLYEALTGHVPHEAPSFSELVLAALHNPVLPVRELRPDCPLELERIVLKALSRERSDRYCSPLAMSAELDAFARAAGLPRDAEAWRSVAALPERNAGRPAEALESRPLPGLLARANSPRNDALRLAQVCVLGAIVGLQCSALYVHGALPWIDDAVSVSEPRIAKTHADHEGEGSASEDAHTPKLRAHEPVLYSAPMVESVPSPLSSRDIVTTNTFSTVSSLEAAPESEPTQSSAPGLLMQASSAYALGKYARALRLYRRAAQQLEREPAAFRGLGLSAARREEYAEARNALERYLELAPAAGDREAIRARINALPW